MVLKKFFLLFVLLTGCLFNCIAQHVDLTGTYTGELFQGDESYTFTMTLKLKQEGNIITGTLENESQGRSRFFVVYNIEGNIHDSVIEWKDVSIADERSSSTWYWCKKLVQGKITINNNSIVLSCDWKDDNKMMFHKESLVKNRDAACNPGRFVLSKENDVKEIAHADTTATVIVKPKIRKPGDSIFLNRAVDVTQKVIVVSDSLTLSFYDNGEIDNDTITVYYNNAMVLSHQRLSTKALVVTIPIQKNGINELLMFADNEGDIPPNTALLVFTDKGIRREITMISSLKRTGSLIFIKK